MPEMTRPPLRLFVWQTLQQLAWRSRLPDTAKAVSPSAHG